MKIIGNVFIFISAFLIQMIILFGQDNYLRSGVYTDIIPSKQNANAFEISDIAFEGNEYFSNNDLLEYIASRPTRVSIPNKILSTYYAESKKNKHFPKIFVEQLRTSLEQFSNEYNFFNKDVAEADVKDLIDLYNVNGFHFANIIYSFKPQENNTGNILTFHIKENQQYILASSITYKGLELLAPDVKRRLDTLVKIKAGDVFSEEKIEDEVRSVNSLFLRTGYMHSKWSYPSVIMDTVNHTDSIVVVFDLGDRIKIGDIIFVDSTYGQQVLANSTKRKFIRLNTGDYYNQNRIERSINNLLSTGVFESVIIDTVDREYPPDDFTRDFIIKSKYRNLRDWDGGLSYNKTLVDKLYNVGISGEIFHRNMFGSAQAVKLYGGVTLKDIERAIQELTIPDVEFKVGFSFAQPILWQFENNTRVALSTYLEYSRELLNGLFNISKTSVPIIFPTRLPRNQYFSNMNVEFYASREVPVNYSSIVNNALDNATTWQDTNNILSSLALYSKIDNYLNKSNIHWFTPTSNLFSISITGDDRDNIFVTTKGSMTNISIDGINPIFFPFAAVSGGAKYYRLSAIHTRFWKIFKTSVVGVKGRVGHTFVFDEENSFVPQDRQFFAGGANSVRAWRARDLRYSTYAEELPPGTTTNFSKNYIGSKTLIDGSIELRGKLINIPGLSENFSAFAKGLGLGLFIDFGNTFGWYSEENENKTKIKISDYITKLAVGSGFGIRYETPIGPIRLDFATPLYDPLGKRKSFGDLVVVFGIGHAF